MPAKAGRIIKWTLIGAVALVAISVLYVAVTDVGTISISYAESSQPEHTRLGEELRAWGGFELAAEELDAAFLLPENIDVWFTDCGEASAFYQPDTGQVALCYELISVLGDLYAGYVRAEQEIASAVWNTMFFVFYHEMGHAFIHVLDLPITGREEDVVDQLATLILLNGGDAGRDAALQGAAWFWLNARHRGWKVPFWDEHSLDEQRYYNVVCWVYGSSPELHQALLGPDWGLAAARAERCPAEYQRMTRAWDEILSEHTY
jgi:hypothetical protein